MVMKKKGIFCLMLLAIVVAAVGLQSCKAVRTVTTTCTYVEQNDTAKTTTTITSKTVEDYTGVKK